MNLEIVVDCKTCGLKSRLTFVEVEEYHTHTKNGKRYDVSGFVCEHVKNWIGVCGIEHDMPEEHEGNGV